MSKSQVNDQSRNVEVPIERRNDSNSLPDPETLKLIAHETRRSIVRTLWVAEDAPLEFSTLRHRAGIDRSPRFNYHLQQLIGYCVTVTDEGYELSPRGEQYLRAMFAVPSMDDTSGDDQALAD